MDFEVDSETVRFEWISTWWISVWTSNGFREDLGMVDFEIDIEWVSKMDLAMGRVDFEIDFEWISLPRKIRGKTTT